MYEDSLIQMHIILMPWEIMSKATQRTDSLVSETDGNSCNEGSGGRKSLPNFGEASFVLDEHVG
jgi:hypothetical protein